MAAVARDNEDRILVAYRPGSLVCLERDDQGSWMIDRMIRPELLE